MNDAKYLLPVIAYTTASMTATDASTVVLGDTVYTHDANDNVTGDATFLYQYDHANQLTNVVRKADNARVLSCRYDALGRRVEAIRADGTVDRYVYFPGSFLVLAVLDETNAPKELYTRGPDLSGTLDSAGGIGGILACTYTSGPTAPLYHHADLMGHVIALTAAPATLTATFRYTSFGQLVACRGTNMVRNLFASKEREAGSDLVYFGYRYLSPQTGSWLSRDPFEEDASINLHEYVGNDVLNGFDAWGAVKVIQNLKRTKERIRPDQGKAVWGWTEEPRLTEIKDPILEYDSNTAQFKVVQKPELTFQIDIQVVKSGRQEWKEWRRDKNRHRRKMPVFVQGKLSNAAYEHELKRFSAWKEGLEAYWTQIENRTLDMTAPTCEELLQKIDDLFADAYTHWELSAEYRIARFKQVHIYNDKNYSIGIMKNGLFGPKIEYILDKK